MGCSSCGKKNGSSNTPKKSKMVQKTYNQNGKKIKILVSR